MKRVIDGKRYNTETATEVCDCSPRGYYQGDFRYERTTLYRTMRGNWFLAGHGGPMSRWARSCGSNGYTGGSGIEPIDADCARSFLERYGSVEDIERHFGAVLVDA